MVIRKEEKHEELQVRNNSLAALFVLLLDLIQSAAVGW